MYEHRILVALIVAVVGLWLATLVGLLVALPTWEARGQFGDLFGSINSLFSGLAFAGLFYTIVLQQRQLELQRKEIELQREELGLQRLEMEASRGELEKQVRAQQALVKATVAQIAVAGLQARIEAYKISSEGRSFEAKAEHAQFIEKISDAISSLSNKLEEEFRKPG